MEPTVGMSRSLMECIHVRDEKLDFYGHQNQDTAEKLKCGLTVYYQNQYKYLKGYKRQYGSK